MIRKFSYVILILLIQFYNSFCFNYSLETKCCSSNQILNYNLNACVDKDIEISIYLNENYVQDYSLLNYNTTSTVSEEYKLNVSCTFQTLEILLSNQFNISEDNILTPLIIKGAKEFNSSEYCWDITKTKNGSDEIVALTCPCLSGTCVRMCCRKGKFLYSPSDNKGKCYDSPDDFNWSIKDIQDDKDDEEYYIVYGENPICEKGETLSRTNDLVLKDNLPINYTIEKDGLLKIEGKYYDLDNKLSSKYCISPFTSHENLTEIIIEALVCEKNRSDIDTRNNYIYAPLFILGAIFLLATILVHLMLPELRNTVRGLSLLAHCICMFVAYISLAIIQVFTSELHIYKMCTFLGFLTQFTLLAAFFWMNVMCIDISLAFRSMQRMAAEYQMLKSNEKQKFLHYNIYAMGIPFIILITTIWANGNESVPSVMRPHIGYRSCWFGKEDTYPFLIFFYGPFGFLLFLNFVLFIITVFNIYSFSKQTSMINQHDSHRHDNRKSRQRKSVILFMKLFFLMGITWIMEILPWAAADDYVIILYFTDAINLLRSVFIFIVFCWKKKVWIMLTTKYSWKKLNKSVPLQQSSLSSASSSTNQQHQLQNLS